MAEEAGGAVAQPEPRWLISPDVRKQLLEIFAQTPYPHAQQQKHALALAPAPSLTHHHHPARQP